MGLLSNIGNLFSPDRDHMAEQRLDPETRRTLKVHQNNSSKAFFWKQLAQYSLMAATLVGGVATGPALLGVEGATGALANALPWLVGAGAGSLSVGLASSVIANRIEVKDDINVEELYSRRTGQAVADCMHEQQLVVQVPSPSRNDNLPTSRLANDHQAEIARMMQPMAVAVSR